MKPFYKLLYLLFIISVVGTVGYLLIKERKPTFNEIIVFGDSLSDQGNVYHHSNGTFPKEPYFEGRFSSGKVWVEHLAEMMGIDELKPSRLGGTNYAHGGARTGDGFKAGKPNVGEQIKQFLEEKRRANPESLYIVCGGGNDFLGGTFFYTVQNLEKHIIDLADAGAKHILVPNFPALGRAPIFTHEIPVLLEESIVEIVDEQLEKFFEYKLGKPLASMCKGFFPTLKASMPELKSYLPLVVEDISSRIAAFMEQDIPTFEEITIQAFTSANAFSKMHNDHLGRMLDELERHYDITIYRLDMFTIIEEISENPTQFGMTEPYYPAIDPKTSQLIDNVVPDQHLFFDGLHPTGAAHIIFANRAYDLIHGE